MAFSRRQVVTLVSALYLLALTGLAAYVLHSANTYSLPISNAVCALTIGLPPLAGVALETVLSLNDSLAKRGQLQSSRILQTVVSAFLIFESVLATLAGTHIFPPGNLNCALSERWQALYSSKDVSAIRTIQDAFTCCGFRSTKDRAWPFPDADHGANACLVRFERDGPCLEPWQDKERKLAIILLVVPVAVFIWKVAILLAPSSDSSWLPSRIRLPEEGSASDAVRSRKPRAILGRQDLESQEQRQRRGDSRSRAITGSNEESHLALDVNDNRRKSTGSGHEHNPWGEGGATA